MLVVLVSPEDFAALEAKVSNILSPSPEASDEE